MPHPTSGCFLCWVYMFVDPGLLDGSSKLEAGLAYVVSDFLMFFDIVLCFLEYFALVSISILFFLCSYLNSSMFLILYRNNSVD